MGWHNEIEGVLKQHMSEAAAAVCSTLLSAFYAAERVSAGKVDEESKNAVVRMLIGLTFDLPDNPWYRANGAAIWPVYRVAVNAWLDAAHYAKQGADKLPYMVSTRAAVMEIASACLLADKGFAKAREVSCTLRDQLAAVKME